MVEALDLKKQTIDDGQENSFCPSFITYFFLAFKKISLATDLIFLYIVAVLKITSHKL